MLRKDRSLRPIPALLLVAGVLLLAGLACSGLSPAEETAPPPTVPPIPTRAPTLPAPTLPLPPTLAPLVPTQPQGQSGQALLTLLNQTSDSICFVYISPVTSQYWGDDWLGADVISAASQYTFTVPAGAYDLRAEFCQTGEAIEERQVDLSSDSTWTISPSAGAGSTPGTGGQLDYSQEPNYGSTALTSGFAPDPVSVSVTSGGDVDASYLGSGCSGYATSAPDFGVNYTSGAFPTLRFYFVASSGDTTLIINSPNGTWYCVDDSFGTLNPTIDFQAPSSGRYDVWVGSYSSGDFVSGTLYVTENTSNHP